MMAQMPYVVMAETHDGHKLTLRRYETRDAAEDHPVVMSQFSRVWIENRGRSGQTKSRRARALVAPVDAPLPWRVKLVGKAHTTIADATGDTAIILLGRIERRNDLVDKILSVFGKEPS